MTEPATGHSFTADQKALLTQSMELIWEREREPVSIEMGMSDTYAAARVGIEGHAGQPLFLLQSAPGDSGVVFAVLKLGPPPELNAETTTIHATFADAVQHISEAMAAIIREAHAPFRQLHLPGFVAEDRALLAELATVLGRSAGREGFTDLRDVSQGAQACAVGVMERGTPIIIATIVGVNGPDGFECSVRNFQNERVPGLPETFTSVGRAIGAHQAYFTGIATSLRSQAKPWWKKLF